MELITPLPEHQPAFLAALDLAKTCEPEGTHVRHVAFLALRLFDRLEKLHKDGPVERFYLQMAALLHDIGLSEGEANHHKASLKIILRTTLLPLNNKERLIIGSVARYHCKALPSLSHDHYSMLSPAERQLVNRLAALLRLADGLDNTHQGEVRDVSCAFKKSELLVDYVAAARLPRLIRTAREKCDLFQRVFKRPVVFRWKPL